MFSHYTVDNVTVTEIDASVYTEADVLSYQDYFPFGMTMEGRYATGDDYRYGFNGMEKDDEVKGNDNSYTTPFRQYDSRVARWAGIDPVVHHNMSPYNAFDNSPIVIMDPSGADGGDINQKTGAVRGTVYIQADGIDNTTLEETMAQIINNINTVFGQYSVNGNQINANELEFVTVNPDLSGKALDDFKNEIASNPYNTFIQVGNGGNDPSNVGYSYVNGNSASGYFYTRDLAGTNNTVLAHEWGHVLGLSDRYHEGRGVGTNGALIGASSRFTIPMTNLWSTANNPVNDPGYSWQNNLYSGTGAALTQAQLNIMTDITLNEQPYKTALFKGNSTVNYNNADFFRTGRGNMRLDAFSGNTPLSRNSYSGFHVRPGGGVARTNTNFAPTNSSQAIRDNNNSIILGNIQ